MQELIATAKRVIHLLKLWRSLGFRDCPAKAEFGRESKWLWCQLKVYAGLKGPLVVKWLRILFLENPSD